MRNIILNHDNNPELSANSYILVDDDNNAVVIDPSITDSEIVDIIKENNLTLKAILLTHGHFDHIRGSNLLIATFDCPLYISKLDEPLLTNCVFNCSSSYRISTGVVVKYPPMFYDDGDIINIINIPIKVIATPYHTRGSVSLYVESEKILYSGDSLFRFFLGRDNLPTSCPEKRKESLDKLMKLPDDVIVYPGHGVETTIGSERKRIQ